ncbi:hypothetical protein QR66_14025 [Chromobacterium piscinae]|nr:hypothetical protein QR66_14025 [Chromobacterium piscinae]
MVRGLSRIDQFDEFPLIALYQKTDIPMPGGPLGLANRLLQVELEILAEGDVPHAACDATLAAAHAAMLALAERPGCIGIEQAGLVWDGDEENPALGSCLATYHIQYRRPEATL